MNAINNAPITRANNDYSNLNPLEGAAMWRGGRPGNHTLAPSYDYFDVKGRVDQLAPRQVQFIPNSYSSLYPNDTYAQVCSIVARQAATAGYSPVFDTNEPDLGGVSWDSSSPTQWDSCFDAVKAVNPASQTIGPSISYAGIGDVEQFLGLLTFSWVVYRPGSGGHRPPRVSMAIAINASGL